MDSLFGSKSVEHVLLYLLVNGKGYGAQMKRTLCSPLTPLQKALDRLERGGIILGYYEGKTRIFQFNPAYPLLEELKALLQRAYSTLPTQGKCRYCYVEPARTNAKDNAKTLHAFWKRLHEVKSLSFIATSKTNGGWDGQGKGVVLSTKEGGNVLVFHEKGSWKDRKANVIDFSNVFRWTIDRHAQVISLEHLRLGPEKPVFLFHLAPSGKDTLSSIDSHICGEDAYFGQIICNQTSLRLTWRIIGPKKNEEIHTSYM